MKEKVIVENGEEKKVGRDWNNRESYRRNWWVFGEPRAELRPALRSLQRYIATVETAKHRVFQFLDADILPDNRLVVVASSDAFHLGVLSSRIHEMWAIATGGTLEDRPIYTKSAGFDPFPFPVPDEFTRARIAALAEKIDRHRKDAQSAYPEINLTEIYNVLESTRAGKPLSDEEREVFDKALVLVLKEYHDELDKAVVDAYGWPQAMSEEEILGRLVALNRERAVEEARGQVRWLRPNIRYAASAAPRTSRSRSKRSRHCSRRQSQGHLPPRSRGAGRRHHGRPRQRLRPPHRWRARSGL